MLTLTIPLLTNLVLSRASSELIRRRLDCVSAPTRRVRWVCISLWIGLHTSLQRTGERSWGVRRRGDAARPCEGADQGHAGGAPQGQGRERRLRNARRPLDGRPIADGANAWTAMSCLLPTQFLQWGSNAGLPDWQLLSQPISLRARRLLYLRLTCTGRRLALRPCWSPVQPGLRGSSGEPLIQRTAAGVPPCASGTGRGATPCLPD